MGLIGLFVLFRFQFPFSVVIERETETRYDALPNSILRSDIRDMFDKDFTFGFPPSLTT